MDMFKKLRAREAVSLLCGPYALESIKVNP